MKTDKKVVFIFLIGIFITLFITQTEVFAISDWQIHRLWQLNGSVQGIQEFPHGYINWEEKEAIVYGKAPLRAESSQHKLLALKAAKMIAQRNLLYLLQEIKYGKDVSIKKEKISGVVALGNMYYYQQNNTFIVKIIIPIKRLIEECVVF